MRRGLLDRSHDPRMPKTSSQRNQRDSCLSNSPRLWRQVYSAARMRSELPVLLLAQSSSQLNPIVSPQAQHVAQLISTPSDAPLSLAPL